MLKMKWLSLKNKTAPVILQPLFPLVTHTDVGTFRDTAAPHCPHDFKQQFKSIW